MVPINIDVLVLVPKLYYFIFVLDKFLFFKKEPSMGYLINRNLIIMGTYFKIINLSDAKIIKKDLGTRIKISLYYRY